MIAVINRRIVLLFITFVFVSGLILYKAIPFDRVKKRNIEIEGIQKRDYQIKTCMQYALIVSIDGYFPCYGCSAGTIFLKRGEVWKYGKTCLGKSKRFCHFRILSFIQNFMVLSKNV